MKKIIGLTGGTGSGKSIFAEYFAEIGATVIDADKISRDITKDGEPALWEINECFPGTVSDGVLDRKALGKIVFNNPESLECLNAITHKYIIARTRELIDECDGMIVLDAPLLYEAGEDALCEKVIFVHAAEDIRLRRIMERDNLSEEDALARIRARNLEEIIKRADILVENNGTKDELKKKFDDILEKL